MSDRVVYAIACAHDQFLPDFFSSGRNPPGPLAAANASSPIKKSRSSVPLFADNDPPDPAPPVRKEGLFATAGRPDPDPPLALPTPPLVAIAVGKTKEGESLPAKPESNQRILAYCLGSESVPSLEKPVPLLGISSMLGGWVRMSYLSMTTAGV